MRLKLIVALVVTAVVAGAAALSASAFYGNGAQIVSADFGRFEQADSRTFATAISADGGQVAFETVARNLFPDGDADPPGQYRDGGIFMFNVASRRLELVADGDFKDEGSNALLVRGAQNLSVSFSGRFVAFSTGQRLVSQDTNGRVDVYVRDMAVPLTPMRETSGAYELVSAQDGTDLPAQYPAPANPGRDPGSEVARASGISADGQRVAFRTLQPSSLPARPSPDTPANQVWVRDREANSTTLMTRTDPVGAPTGGAEGSPGLSADGSTVIWTGTNAPSQTEFVQGENTSSNFPYYLWRRVAGGSTRRITGQADPEDPGCGPGDSIVSDGNAQGPCYGPLAQPEGLIGNIRNLLPALSSDGLRVTYLTGSPPRGASSGSSALDLFVTDMSSPSRKSGTTELTRDPIGGDASTGSTITGLAMSSNGRFAALTTVRTRFVLPALRFLGSARSAPTARELYVVDLDARTIERASRSADGGEIDGDVGDGLSLSVDGGRVAFTSSAGNLFFGDSNGQPDGFVVTRQPEPGESPPPPPEGGSGVQLVEDLGGSGGPQIGVRARSLRNGSVELIVRVPGAGGVKAEAKARVGQPRRRRSLAVRTGRARRAGRVRLVLSPVRRYRREVSRRRRVLTRVSVGYVASRGGRRLRTSVRATFKRPEAPRKKKSPRRVRKR